MIELKTMLVAAVAVTMAAVAFGDGAKKAGAFRPPAVPLVSVDPHFSLWSAADRLYDADTTFWTGRPQPLLILLEADGVTYRLCGRGTSSFLNDLPTLPQTECRVGAGVEMTPFLVGVAAVLSETASICCVMVPYPRLPRRKEVASSAKGGGSLIGSKYEPARQYG